MIEFIVYLMCSLGISYAWSDTDVARPFRNMVARIPYINKPLLCHECSSFWISLIITLLFNPLSSMAQPIVSNIISAFCGFFINLIFVRNGWVGYKN